MELAIALVIIGIIFGTVLKGGCIGGYIRETGRRIKKVGGSWTDKGILNLIKLFWKRAFESDELKRFWREAR